MLSSKNRQMTICVAKDMGSEFLTYNTYVCVCVCDTP